MSERGAAAGTGPSQRAPPGPTAAPLHPRFDRCLHHLAGDGALRAALRRAHLRAEPAAATAGRPGAVRPAPHPPPQRGPDRPGECGGRGPGNPGGLSRPAAPRQGRLGPGPETTGRRTPAQQARSGPRPAAARADQAHQGVADQRQGHLLRVVGGGGKTQPAGVASVPAATRTTPTGRCRALERPATEALLCGGPDGRPVRLSPAPAGSLSPPRP